MTTPTERGLFERIKDQIDMHHCCNFPQAIEKICAEFEQRFAAAQDQRDNWCIDYNGLLIVYNECAQKLAAAREEVAKVEHQRDKALSDVDHRDNVLELITNSISAAFERAGLDAVDDPGESIDVLAEERDQLKALLAAKNEIFQNIIDECGNRPFTRMLAVTGFELTAPLPEKKPGSFTINGKDPAEFFDDLKNKPEKNGS